MVEIELLRAASPGHVKLLPESTSAAIGRGSFGLRRLGRFSSSHVGWFLD